MYFPNLTLRMWDSVGHFYMYEKPGELTEAMRDFLTGFK